MGSFTRYPSYDCRSCFNRTTNHTCKSRCCIHIHPASAPTSNDAPAIAFCLYLKAKGAKAKAKAPAPAPALNRTPPTKPLESIPERRSLIQAASAVTTLSAREERRMLAKMATPAAEKAKTITRRRNC
ncbi:hypothetical protein M422DRAFT_35835 [Sphaerobolus stellatus SS14]|uniref:Uncharacterized protein n=1 Tax=Sphaerobolus stellatus (strain SS14) TaxID=990650 RepID=A0A0C9UCP8_SPHS4|nr:hypothetical protein M422DRAFT_35835 [Sphaerobolus stellatus SS14]